jgi:hypothetical protein
MTSKKKKMSTSMINPQRRLMTILSLFRGSPQRVLAEPSWDEVLSSADERQAAASYWRGIASAIRVHGTAHSHAVLRLVVAYIVADRASAEILRGGAGELAWRAHADASRLATEIELHLGLLPPTQRRGSA